MRALAVLCAFGFLLLAAGPALDSGEIVRWGGHAVVPDSQLKLKIGRK